MKYLTLSLHRQTNKTHDMIQTINYSTFEIPRRDLRINDEQKELYQECFNQYSIM